MVAATKRAIAAAPHLADARFAGGVQALLALAEIIDKAKAAGEEAYAKAAFGAIPSYVKTCEALLLTPASLPRPKEPEGRGSKISKFAEAADARRRGVRGRKAAAG